MKYMINLLNAQTDKLIDIVSLLLMCYNELNITYLIELTWSKKERKFI